MADEQREHLNEMDTPLGPEPPPHGEPVSGPLFEASEIRFGQLRNRKFAARRWLFRELLPESVVGILGAQGGVGKSYLSIQMAVALALGRPFLGHETERAGSSLILAAEEDDAELRRRVIQCWPDRQPFAPENFAIDDRVHIKSVAGLPWKMTTKSRHGSAITSLPERIAETGRQISELRLIVLDPVSRFRNGDENDNDDATRFIEAVERIRNLTGATVLLPHHMRKPPSDQRWSAERMHNFRGASALIDGVRWAATMTNLDTASAKAFGIDKTSAADFVRLDVVKSNYSMPGKSFLLKRRADGGFVRYREPAGDSNTERPPRIRPFEAVLPELKELVIKLQNDGRSVTRNKLRKYAGTDKPLGISDNTLRGYIDRAVAEGELVEHPSRPGRRGKTLSVKGHPPY